MFTHLMLITIFLVLVIRSIIELLILHKSQKVKLISKIEDNIIDTLSNSDEDFLTAEQLSKIFQEVRDKL